MRAGPLLIASLLLLASTATASGQVVRPPLSLPASASSGGISVVGRASIRLRPDLLRFTARFSLRPTSMDALLAQIDAVTQAFAKAGVDANTLSRDVGPIYAQNQAIELTINGSARPAPAAQLASTYQNVMMSVANVSGLAFQNFSASYALQDCTAAEEQARVAAIADAHRRAQAIAHDEGVSLGDLLSASENTFGSAACPIQPNFQSGALDMSAQPMVSLTTQVTVTYAIRRP